MTEIKAILSITAGTYTCKWWTTNVGSGDDIALRNVKSGIQIRLMMKQHILVLMQ